MAGANGFATYPAGTQPVRLSHRQVLAEMRAHHLAFDAGTISRAEWCERVCSTLAAAVYGGTCRRPEPAPRSAAPARDSRTSKSTGTRHPAPDHTPGQRRARAVGRAGR